MVSGTALLGGHWRARGCLPLFPNDVLVVVIGVLVVLLVLRRAPPPGTLNAPSSIRPPNLGTTSFDWIWNFIIIAQLIIIITGKLSKVAGNLHYVSFGYKEPTRNLFRDFNGWFSCHVQNYGLYFEINENLFEDARIVYVILWANLIFECRPGSLSVYFFMISFIMALPSYS
jgi:hypothetical protein